MKKIILILSLISSITLFAQSSASKRDTKFVKCAVEGSMMEVKLGQLALQNGSSPEVKKLAQQMVDDHTKAGNEQGTGRTKKFTNAHNHEREATENV